MTCRDDPAFSRFFKMPNVGGEKGSGEREEEGLWVAAMAFWACHEVTFGYGWFRPRKRRICHVPPCYFLRILCLCQFVSKVYVYYLVPMVGCNGFSCLQKVEFHLFAELFCSGAELVSSCASPTGSCRFGFC